MHRTGYSSADSESLQTDVMRFMAIIAFCLIAILALVRNVEPTGVQTATPPSLRASAPVPEPAASIRQVADPAPLRAMEPISPLPANDPLQGTRRLAAKMAASAPTPAVAEAAATEATAPSEVEAPEAAQGEEGLSLRFASDRDFMRLVAKGDIQVYAFKAQDVLTLDRTFRFLESPAPDRVYELLPETIPALMASALDSARTDTGGYVWGIRMPQGLEQRIRAFIDQGARGQLIINRYGEVQHAAGA
jgi:hypothetical protein